MTSSSGQPAPPCASSQVECIYQDIFLGFSLSQATVWARQESPLPPSSHLSTTRAIFSMGPLPTFPRDLVSLCPLKVMVTRPWLPPWPSHEARARAAANGTSGLSPGTCCGCGFWFFCLLLIKTARSNEKVISKSPDFALRFVYLFYVFVYVPMSMYVY